MNKQSQPENNDDTSALGNGAEGLWTFDRHTLLTGLISLLLGIAGLVLLFKPTPPDAGQGMGPQGMQWANNPAGLARTAATDPTQWGGGTALTGTELEHLTFMREEEKLAKDVYQALYQHWKLSLFASISRSEERHTRVIATLLSRHRAQDPALNTAPGEFHNPQFAKLYQDLMQKARKSALDALQVGALIEEVDIRDLDTALQSSTRADILQGYRNIQNGSYHHLRAFVHAIELFGQGYTAQVLPQNRVNDIIHSALTQNPGGQATP